MNEDKQLIELHGHTTGVLRKTKDYCMFFFNDYVYGRLVCTAEKDCMLYYWAERDREYHLKVVLQGHTTTREDGTRYTRNALVIKEIG